MAILHGSWIPQIQSSSAGQPEADTDPWAGCFFFGVRLGAELSQWHCLANRVRNGLVPNPIRKMRIQIQLRLPICHSQQVHKQKVYKQKVCKMSNAGI